MGQPGDPAVTLFSPVPRPRLLVVAVVVTLLAMAPGIVEAQGSRDLGALVRTTARSTVGVVLDEIPTFMRDRITASLIAQPTSFWVARAHRQLQLTTYRLVF